MHKVKVRVYDCIVSPMKGAFLYRPLPLEGFKSIVNAAERDERSDLKFYFFIENIEMLEREADMKIPRHLVIDRSRDQEHQTLIEQAEYRTGDMMILLHNQDGNIEIILGHYFDIRSGSGILGMLFQDYFDRKDSLSGISLQDHIQGCINAIQQSFDNHKNTLEKMTKEKRNERNTTTHQRGD